MCRPRSPLSSWQGEPSRNPERLKVVENETHDTTTSATESGAAERRPERERPGEQRCGQPERRGAPEVADQGEDHEVARHEDVSRSRRHGPRLGVAAAARVGREDDIAAPEVPFTAGC